MINMNCNQVDANWDYEGNMCATESDTGFVCTRRKGHLGKHHAHGIDQECCEVWE